MKTSIKKLLSSLQFNAMLLILIIVVTGLLLGSSMATFKRIDNMALQEQMVKEITKKERKDPELDRIQVNGILGRLPILIDKFENDESFEFVNGLVIGEGPKRIEQGTIMRERYKQLSASATDYFNSDASPETKKGAAELNRMRQELLIAIDAYVFALYPATKLQNDVLRSYILLAEFGIGFVLLWALSLLFMTIRASKLILADIHGVLSQEPSKIIAEQLHTSEINSVALRLRQESGEASLAPSKKDEVTQLPNYDGIKATFDRRPPTPKNLSTYVCIFEIDNYSKLINHFPQSVIDPILIKIASIMKLHKMQNDLIGRLDDSHFIAVFIRPEKQKAFGDSDHIRQMVEENRFKLPHTNYQVTISGGFAAKMSSQTLDDAVKNARAYLKYAQEKGGNAVDEGKNTPKIL